MVEKIFVNGPMFIGGPRHGQSAGYQEAAVFESTENLGTGEIHSTGFKVEPGDPKLYRARKSDFYERMSLGPVVYPIDHYVHRSLTKEQAEQYI